MGLPGRTARVTSLARREVLVKSTVMVHARIAIRSALALSLASSAACSMPDSEAAEYEGTGDPAVRMDGGANQSSGDGTVSAAETGAFDDASNDACVGVVDCMGVCNGTAVLDECGVCNGRNASKDCMGVCGGSAQEDCKGVCNGPDKPTTFYGDLDGDGLGDPKAVTQLCAATNAVVTNGNDCDDALKAVCKPSLQLRFKRKLAGSTSRPYNRTAMAALGDLDADGVPDFIVADTLVYMRSDGTVKSARKIVFSDLGLATAAELDPSFGASVAALGDVDGDRIPDVAIGEPGAAGVTPVSALGRVWILLIKTPGVSPAGTAPFAGRFQVRFTPTSGSVNCQARPGFGTNLAALDLNGDGKLELAASSNADCFANGTRVTGRIDLLRLANTGAPTLLKSLTYDKVPYGMNDFTGASLAATGDVDGNGVGDLAVGIAPRTGVADGKLWTLLLNATGDIIGTPTRLSSGDANDPALASLQRAVAALPAPAGRSARDLLLSLPALTDRGGMAAALPRATGTPGYRVFYPGEVGVLALAKAGDNFGQAAAALGDLDQDGLPEVAVMAPGDDSGGAELGALYMMGFAADCSNQTLRGDCNATASDGCETLLNVADHCGACGQVCTGRPNSSGGSCTVEGKCALTCTMGFGDCNGDPRDGCEVNLQTSVAHCGSCAAAECPVKDHLLPACVNGACTVSTKCEGMWNDLVAGNDGCESCGVADQQTRYADAGIPAPARCGPDQICSQERFSPTKDWAYLYGKCVTKCPVGRGDCDGNAANGCEANLTLQSRCGGCGLYNGCGVWEFLEYCVLNATGTGYECK